MILVDEQIVFEQHGGPEFNARIRKEPLSGALAGCRLVIEIWPYKDHTKAGVILPAGGEEVLKC